MIIRVPPSERMGPVDFSYVRMSLGTKVPLEQRHLINDTWLANTSIRFIREYRIPFNALTSRAGSSVNRELDLSLCGSSRVLD